jgi:hypothetical protein
VNVTDYILLGEYFLSVLGSLLIIVRYSFAGWWRSREGRAIFGLHGGLFLLGMLTAFFLAFGDEYFGRQALRIVAVNLLLVSTWTLTYSLFKAQAEGKRKRIEALAKAKAEGGVLQ